MFFFTQVFFILFFVTFCFCSSRFAFTSFFHFLLCLICFFLDLLLFFLNSFFSTSTFFDFFEQQVPFFWNQKTLQIITFCMHALPLYVLFLLMDLFICCLFFSSCFLVSITFVSLFLLLFSVHITSFENKFMELPQIQKKLVCLSLFCWAVFHIYFCMFVLLFDRFFFLFCFMLICF